MAEIPGPSTRCAEEGHGFLTWATKAGKWVCPDCLIVQRDMALEASNVLRDEGLRGGLERLVIACMKLLKMKR